MNRTFVTGWLIGALLVTSGAAARAEEPGGLWSARYREFLGEAKRVREAMASVYGSHWKPASLTSEIAREVSWLEGEEARLQWDHSRLAESARNLAGERDLLRRQTRLLQIDLESLDREMQPLDAEEAALREQLGANQRRIAIHNSSPPPQDDPAALARYNEEASALNGELKRLEGEFQRVEEAKGRIAARREPLFARAAELATRDHYLERTAQAFEADAGQFAGRCEEAVYRTRAFAVIAGSKPADLIQGFRRVYEPRPNAVVAVLQSVGESAALGVLAKLAVRGTGAVGLAFSARDLYVPQIRRGGEDVQDRLLLVGDYAAALKRLKQDKYPDERDLDYQALRRMLERTGKGMPGSTAQFVAQSTRLSELLQDGLSTLAKGYVLKKVLPDSGQLGVPLARAEKESIERLSERMVTSFEIGIKGAAKEKAGEMTVDAVFERTMKDFKEATGRTASREGDSR